MRKWLYMYYVLILHKKSTLTEVDPLCWRSHWRQSESLPKQLSWGLLSAGHRTCTRTCSSTTSECIIA